MNDNPLTAVREARERISAAVDHDPEKLVERCRKIKEQYPGRMAKARLLEDNSNET